MDEHLTVIETQPQSNLSLRVREALTRAMMACTKLSADVVAMGGMSGKKYRYFINNLIESLDDPRYLEVGVWEGSTFCAAIFGNRVTATAIDDWSQFGGPSTKFFANLSRYKGPDAKVSFLEMDFKKVDYASLGQHDVYLFDGPHAEDDQFSGLTISQPALASEYVVIVDDWNWSQVRNGTFRAIQDLKLTVDFAAEICTTLDNSTPKVGHGNSDWHNGYFIAAVRKTLV